MSICKICNKEYKRLGSHIKTHGISIQQYYDKYEKKNYSEGICPICKKPTTFLGLTEGYSMHCSLNCAQKDIEVKHKREQTCLNIFGAKNVFASEYGKETIKHTMKEKYGVEYPLQNSQIKQKAKETCLKNNGFNGFNQEKVRRTKLLKYDSENPTAFGTDWYKQRMIDLYGAEYAVKRHLLKKSISIK